MATKSWSDVGDIVAKYAPGIAADLVGPWAGLVGSGIALALGKGDDQTPEGVYEALKNDPEAIKALASVDTEKLKLEGIKIESRQKEMQSARDMNIAAIQAGRGEIQERLAYAIIALGFGLVAAVLFVPGDYIDDQMRNWAFPFAQSLISMVVGFYFGSTQWSNRNAVPSNFTANSKTAGFMDEVKTKK